MTIASPRCVAAALLVLLAAGGPARAQKSNGAVLPGGNSKQPVNIEANKLDYFDKEQKLVYTGSVVAVQGDSTLKSSVLTIFLAPKKSAGKGAEGAAAGSSNQIQRMLAAGPVTMVQKDQVGTGDNATYDKAADTVILTGNVVLTQGENVTKGDKLVYDLKTGHATVTGQRVVGMFRTGGDAPAAAPTGDSGRGDAKPSSRRSGRRSPPN